MSLKEFLRLALVNLHIVLMAVCLTSITGLFYIKNQPTLFQSTARIFVSTESSSLDLSGLVSGSSFSQQRVKSYEKIVASPLTLQPVIDQLKLEISAHDLAARVFANAPEDTVLLDISAVDGDPFLAAKLANSIAAQFIVTVKELESDASGETVGSPVKASLVDYAIPSTSPASPDGVQLMSAFLLLGLISGCGFILLRRKLLDVIRNEEDLFGIPLIMANAYDEEAESKPLLNQIDKYSSRAESFRSLRANIQHIDSEFQYSVIAVTSALAGEGKTTTAINLALSFSRAGKKTILVEADLRRPKVSSYFNLPNDAVGLSELILNDKKGAQSRFLKNYIRRDEEKIMDFITSGALPPYPSELFENDNFTSLVDILRAKYDYVIIDCPPCLPVSDAISIASRSDCALIVVKANSTRVQQFKGVKNLLERTGSKVLGAVINMIPFDARDAEDYGYRYGYTYSLSRRYGPLSKYRYGKYGYGKYGYGKYGNGKYGYGKYGNGDNDGNLPYAPRGYSPLLARLKSAKIESKD
jgi:non-specific protein-tyrosine kinase